MSFYGELNGNPKASEFEVGDEFTCSAFLSGYSLQVYDSTTNREASKHLHLFFWNLWRHGCDGPVQFKFEQHEAGGHFAQAGCLITATSNVTRKPMKTKEE